MLIVVAGALTESNRFHIPYAIREGAFNADNLGNYIYVATGNYVTVNYKSGSYLNLSLMDFSE